MPDARTYTAGLIARPHFPAIRPGEPITAELLSRFAAAMNDALSMLSAVDGRYAPRGIAQQDAVPFKLFGPQPLPDGYIGVRGIMLNNDGTDIPLPILYVRVASYDSSGEYDAGKVPLGDSGPPDYIPLTVPYLEQGDHGYRITLRDGVWWLSTPNWVNRAC